MYASFRYLTRQCRTTWKQATRYGLCVCVALVTSALPAHGQEQWRFIEEVRIGSLSEGPAQFGEIRGVALGSEGRILVLDGQQQEIRIFDASGRFVRQVARRGAGPGEIRNANGLLTAPSAVVWVNDPGNARQTLFSPLGDFVSQRPVPPRQLDFYWDAAFDADGALMEYMTIRQGRVRRAAVLRFTSTGTIRDTLPLPECGWKDRNQSEVEFVGRGRGGRRIFTQIPFATRPVTAFGLRGTMWCSTRERYEVLQIVLTSGDTALRLVKNERALPIPQAERDAAIEQVRTIFRAIGAADPDFAQVPRTKPVIEQLDADDRGRLWVRRTSTNDSATDFDVWDRGKLIAQVRVPWRVPPLHHIQVRGDKVYATGVDADGVPFVVRARIERLR